ncbi:hypothetical protein PG997_010675 [Apiospora hydei]|uniref:Uncharacterized protein n=1 Tax=Apiospora hydei TaxID=1337664 RepID=A0ABR1VGY7_9PEZI
MNDPSVPVYRQFSHDVKELLDDALRVLPVSHPYHSIREQTKQDFLQLWRFRHRVSLFDLIREFFGLIDEYFFFSNIGPHVQLSVRHIYSRYDYWEPRTQRIVIHTLAWDRRHWRRSRELVASVLHEAVYAYLDLFTTQRSFEAEGLDRNPHGMSFHVLYQTLTNTINRWVPDPTGFAVICYEDGDEEEAELHHLLSYSQGQRRRMG